MMNHTEKYKKMDIVEIYFKKDVTTRKDNDSYVTSNLTEFRLKELENNINLENYMDRLDYYLARVPGRVVYDFKKTMYK